MRHKSLTETQQKVLNVICIRGGGVDIHEAMSLTGYSYPTILQAIFGLMSKGYLITALPENLRGTIKRVYLSPYDERHNELIKQED